MLTTCLEFFRRVKDRISFRTIVALWIIVFSGAVLWNNINIRNLLHKDHERLAISNQLIKENRHLARQNRRRIADIQASRVESCERTYTVIRKLLIASTQGIKLQGEEKVRFKKLMKLADPHQCKRQTSPKSARSRG